MTTFAFMPIYAWEYESVIEEGIRPYKDDSGIVMFHDKEEAIKRGIKESKIKVFDELIELDIEGEKHKIPVFAEYDYFYIASIDMDLLKQQSNSAPQLADFEDIPKLWFTREPIPVICIIHSEKIPI